MLYKILALLLAVFVALQVECYYAMRQISVRSWRIYLPCSSRRSGVAFVGSDTKVFPWSIPHPTKGKDAISQHQNYALQMSRKMTDCYGEGTSYKHFTRRRVSTSGKDVVSTNGIIPQHQQKVAIVGGGLAGLSTAYHLLSKIRLCDKDLRQGWNVTIYDRCPIGMGGASSVAGGLLHPLSPSGKLVHWGIQGLASTNQLISVAQTALSEIRKVNKGASNVVLRDELFRLVVQNDNNPTNKEANSQTVERMKDISQIHADFAEWLDSQQINELLHSHEKADNVNILGGLRLFNGCKVIHVPTYLQGLYIACQNIVNANPTLASIQWINIPDAETISKSQGGPSIHRASPSAVKYWRNLLSDYDTVVFAAGSGIFINVNERWSEPPDEVVASYPTTGIFPKETFPVELVTGQSIEMKVPYSDEIKPIPALLCGKYISPLPNPSLVLLGATHEFKFPAMSTENVISEMKDRTFSFAPFLWKEVDTLKAPIHRITSGVRVQSNRGVYGRMPIIGKLDSQFLASSTNHSDTRAATMEKYRHDFSNELIHSNAWIITGLSSRGLLYHSLYGDVLTDAILLNSEESILSRCPDLLWWKSKTIRSSRNKSRKTNV